MLENERLRKDKLNENGVFVKAYLQPPCGPYAE
jgi:hypothetical protein